MAKDDGRFWPPYVPVAERYRRAMEQLASMTASGRDVSPVRISGRTIAKTFWGVAWCRNLEAYSDFANRLPRGRTYVRRGSVIDLRIEGRQVRALVSGTEVYEVEIRIEPLSKGRWSDIKRRCAGQINSLVELLRGSISEGVMEIVTHKDEGLFPSPREISLSCSCPDGAIMCKHVAASLYGVGARLDRAPELLFCLRGLDPAELVEAAVEQPVAGGRAHRGRVFETDTLSSLFGVEIDTDGIPSPAGPTPTTRSKTPPGRVSRSRKSGTLRAAARKKGIAPRSLSTEDSRRVAKKAVSSTKASSHGTTATKVSHRVAKTVTPSKKAPESPRRKPKACT